MTREVLGEFEHQVLLALLRLGDDAYSTPIVLELEEHTHRSVRSAAVYIVLRRLEEKGWVRSRMCSPGAEGGRHRRHFAVTDDGLTRVKAACATYRRLWDGLESVIGEVP